MLSVCVVRATAARVANILITEEVDMAKGGKQKAAFAAQKQKNQIVAQLNSLKKQGFTTDQVRAAGNNAYKVLNGASTNVTVKDGDTLEKIANANGTTPTDLLNANPDVRSITTGMVLNAPQPGQANWQGSGYATGGLPSNAPLSAATSTNPSGNNPYAGMDPKASLIGRGRGTGTNFGTPTVNDMPYSYFGTDAKTTPVNPVTNSYNVASRGANATMAPAQIPTATTSTTNPYSGFSSLASQSRAAKNDFIPLEYLSLAQSPAYTPSPEQTAYLERMGYLTKNTQASSGGGGYYRNYGRGGGRGGGGSGTPRVSQAQAKVPAFASGSGFKGLINWRI